MKHYYKDLTEAQQQAVNAVISRNGNEILAFRIGSKGRPGCLNYLGEQKINRFTDNLFTAFENEREYFKDLTQVEVDEARDLITDRKWDDLYSRFGIKEADLGDEIFTDANGNPVGLNVENNGTGVIDFDGEYDTVYSIFASEAGEREINAILHSGSGYYGLIREEMLEEIEKLEEKEEEE